LSVVVVDCSVTVAWLFKDEHDVLAMCTLQAVVEGEGAAPPLWSCEVANAILVAERRGRLTPDDRDEAIRNVTAVPVRVMGPPLTGSVHDLVGFARDYRLTAYDAEYLRLALVMGLPLATLDSELRRAAEEAGVPLFA